MTKQECSLKGQTLLWWIVNQKNEQQNIATAGWWSFEQNLVTGAGLDSRYQTGIRWIGGRWFRTGICWRRKVFAGPGLVVTGICWHRKVVTGSGLVVAGVCWGRKVVASSGLVVACVCWDRKVVAGSGLVVAGICWCRKGITGSGLVDVGVC